MTLPPSDRHEHQLPARRADTGRAPTNSLPHSPSVQPFAEQDKFGPEFFLWVFRQWWKVVVPIGIVLAGVAAVTILVFHVPQYEAKALILIEDQAPFLAFKDGGTSRSNPQRYLQTQVELLRSEIVLGPVLSRPEVASLAELTGQTERLGYLKKHVAVNQVGKSVLYEVAYVSPSPQGAADVANAIVDTYLTIQIEEDEGRSRRVIQILDEERAARLVEVERLRGKVTELAEVLGGDVFGGNSNQMGMFPASSSSLYQAITEVDVEREILKAEIQAIREAPILTTKIADSGLLEFDIENHPQVREQLVAIAEIEFQMEAIKNNGERIDWRKDPDYRRLEQVVSQMQSDLEEMKTSLRYGLASQQKELRKQKNQLALAELERELAKLDAKSTLLEQKYEERRQEAKSGGAIGVDFEFARAELARKEKVFELIEARKVELQTEMRAPARVRPMQNARVPMEPVEPVPYKLLLAGCLAAFLLPFGLAIAREATVRRVSNADHLYQESKTRVLGEVARIPIRRVLANGQALNGRIHQDMTVFAESIDALRTNMVLSQSGDQIQVIAVTSAVAGEGKTTIATALTASIAGATRKPTLIIDADLRSPDVAAVLKIEDQPGLSELLAGECELEDAIHHVGDGDTYVMPAGKIKRNPHHLIQFEQIGERLGRLREQFGNIVIDTGPVLGASESLIFAKAADAVLYCCLSDSSRARQVNVALDRLRHAGCNIAGSVLSGTPVRQYASVYGYYPRQT